MLDQYRYIIIHTKKVNFSSALSLEALMNGPDHSIGLV